MAETNAAATTIAADPTVEVNPLSAMNAGVTAARNVTSLRSEQFNLQQSQLQPAYQSMRMLMATNPNPTMDDVNVALAQSARIGGNVNGLVQNFTDFMTRGGKDAKPADWMRATALGGMSPETQGTYVYPQRMNVNTGSNLVYGTTPGLATPNAGQFNPAGSIELGLTPAERTDIQQVGVNPDGSPIMRPRGVTYGQPLGGGGGVGGGSGAAPAGAPPGSSAQPGQPLSQKDADLARFSMRESGNQNIFSNVKVPGYTQEQTGSGYYQIIPSTWAEGQTLAGIPPAQQTKLAIQASPQQQYQVASAIYDKYGGRPWAQSAPGGAGGGGGGGGPPASGVFLGATSAQPVTGGAPAQSVGVGPPVQPVGGMQRFDASGQPMGQGGATTPYTGYTGLPATFEKTAAASAEMFNTARANYTQQAQRISPLEQSLATLRAHPDLQTGMTAMDFQNINSLAQVLGVQLSPQSIADGSALTEINKNLNRYYRGLPGANRSDMAELDAKLANPSPENQRDALDDLLARTVGAERMNDAGYMHFLESHGGGNASNYAGQYADQTGQYTSKLDPVGFAFDKMTLQQRRAYFDSLSPTEKTRYMNSIKEASRLYNLPIPQGG